MDVTSFPALLQSSLRRPFRDLQPRKLFLVHIGKCGGSSLRDATKKSRVVKNLFVGVRRFHFEEPEYSEMASYLFAIRNPILRTESAYYYRRSLLERGGQEKRKGEKRVFATYQSFNELAEALFDGSQTNRAALNAWNAIHHLGDESIYFYLNRLVPKLSRRQIFGIVSPEHFDSAIPRLLGVTAPRKRITRTKTNSRRAPLTPLAHANLERLLTKEFQQLKALFELDRTPPRVQGRNPDGSPRARARSLISSALQAGGVFLSN